LYLHHYHHQGIHKTMIAWPEGIPAQVTLPLLPLRSRLRLGVWLHVVLPAGPAAATLARGIRQYQQDSVLR